MAVQEYIVHLANGDKVSVYEDYDLEGPKTLISQYRKYINDPTKCFCVGDDFIGFDYIPWRNVTHISTGDVYAGDEWRKDNGKRKQNNQ